MWLWPLQIRAQKVDELSIKDYVETIFWLVSCSFTGERAIEG